LGKAILGDNSIPKESLLFTVVLHFATALSTIVIFRKDIWSLLKGIVKLKWNEDLQFVSKIALSMLPAAVIGFTYESELAKLFGGNIKLVGFMLILTALLLYLADKAKDTSKQISFKNALVIGFAQAIAMLPGISRSGATISTSVLLGNDKTKAARFSFLMVVPLIFGKIAKDILSGDLTYENSNFTILSVGFFAAFIAGLFACTWMIRLVKNSKLSYFSIYCLVIGLIAIAIASR
jgi:undecaprenyl-diphosphatase